MNTRPSNADKHPGLIDLQPESGRARRRSSAQVAADNKAARDKQEEAGKVEAMLLAKIAELENRLDKKDRQAHQPIPQARPQLATQARATTVSVIILLSNIIKHLYSLWCSLAAPPSSNVPPRTTTTATSSWKSMTRKVLTNRRSLSRLSQRSLGARSLIGLMSTPFEQYWLHPAVLSQSRLPVASSVRPSPRRLSREQLPTELRRFRVLVDSDPLAGACAVDLIHAHLQSNICVNLTIYSKKAKTYQAMATPQPRATSRLPKKSGKGRKSLNAVASKCLFNDNER